MCCWSEFIFCIYSPCAAGVGYFLCALVVLLCCADAEARVRLVGSVLSPVAADDSELIQKPNHLPAIQLGKNSLQSTTASPSCFTLPILSWRFLHSYPHIIVKCRALLTDILILVFSPLCCFFERDGVQGDRKERSLSSLPLLTRVTYNAAHAHLDFLCFSLALALNLLLTFFSL